MKLHSNSKFHFAKRCNFIILELLTIFQDGKFEKLEKFDAVLGVSPASLDAIGGAK